MGKPKQELILNLPADGIFNHDLCDEYENTIVFNFLNANFDSITEYEIISLFGYDQMMGQISIDSGGRPMNFNDFRKDFDLQRIYFHFLQLEFREYFNKIRSESNKEKFKILGNEILNLGKLEYSLSWGDLKLHWDDNITSFRQVLLRSFITFLKGDEKILKYLCVCQCSDCDKLYFNKSGNPKFCIPKHGKTTGDKIRNQSKRYELESSNEKYARYKTVKKKYDKSKS